MSGFHSTKCLLSNGDLLVMKRQLSISELLTIQFSLGYFLMFLLLANQSLSHDHKEGVEDVNNQPATLKQRDTQYHRPIGLQQGVRGGKCMTQA